MASTSAQQGVVDGGTAVHHKPQAGSMEQLLSFLRQKVMDEAEKGFFKTSFTLSDIGDKFSSQLKDNNFRNMLRDRLKREDDIDFNANYSQQGELVFTLSWEAAGGEPAQRPQAELHFEEDKHAAAQFPTAPAQTPQQPLQHAPSITSTGPPITMKQPSSASSRRFPAGPPARRGQPFRQLGQQPPRLGRIVNPRLNAHPVPVPEPYPRNLRECMIHIPVSQLMIENWVNKRLVLVGDRQSIERALARLNRHNILSLPVLDEASGAFIGILDTLDIIRHLEETSEEGKKGMLARWAFVFKSIRELMDSLNRRAVTIASHASFWDGLKELSKGMQRMMVVDRMSPIISEQKTPEVAVMGLLTQSDILRFIAQNPNWLDTVPKAHMTIKDLNLGRTRVVTVSQDMVAFQAFKVIFDNGISTGENAVAVVDTKGRLVSVLSSSNIRGITRNNFQVLTRTVFEFITRDRRRGWWKIPITVQDTTTLYSLILQFCSTKVHQLYVCDSNACPVRVITLTDVLKQVVD